MSGILEKVIKYGTVPILTKEGISKTFDIIFSYFIGDGKVSDVSRNLTLSDYKDHENSDNDPNEYLQSRKNVLWQVVVALKEDLIKMEGSNYEEKLYNLYNYADCKSKAISIDDLRKILKLENAESTWRFFSINKFSDKKHFYNPIEDLTNFEMEHIGVSNDLFFGVNKHEADYDYRIYLNLPSGVLGVKFLEIYATKCIQRRIPYNMKGLYDGAESLDRTILYCHKENLEQVIEILEEIKTEFPSLADSFGSPITTATNYSYYAICHRGGQYIHKFGSRGVPLETYNGFTNKIICLAGASIFAEMIKSTPIIWEVLDVEEKQKIEQLLSFDFKFENLKEKEAFVSNAYKNTKFIKEIVSNNQDVFRNPAIMGRMKNMFLEKFKLWASYLNFGDLDHTECSPSFSKEFYDYFHIEPEITKENAKPGKEVENEEGLQLK